MTAESQWADETGLSNPANYGRSFAPRGKTPIIRRLAARSSQSMISSLTNRGKLRFMVDDGALNAGIFLRFLKRLVRGAQRKIFLILGPSPRTSNRRPHRARIVTAWVAANSDAIELVDLPSYAPEHNPDEVVNNKQAMARRRVPKHKADLKKGLTSYRPSEGPRLLPGADRRRPR
jgi:hypothetical protein